MLPLYLDATLWDIYEVATVVAPGVVTPILQADPQRWCVILHVSGGSFQCTTVPGLSSLINQGFWVNSAQQPVILDRKVVGGIACTQLYAKLTGGGQTITAICARWRG